MPPPILISMGFTVVVTVAVADDVVTCVATEVEVTTAVVVEAPPLQPVRIRLANKIQDRMSKHNFFILYLLY